MTIEVLYFQGCPDCEPTMDRVRQVASRLGIEAAVREAAVSPNDDPAALKYLGSPTVRVDGRDIDPTSRDHTSYGFGCRTFADQGVPSEELIETALREAAT